MNFRPTTKEDSVHIADNIEKDPFHSGDASFWLPDKDKEKQLVWLTVEDDKGVIGYLRLENMVRIQAQFVQGEHRRTAVALDWVISQLKNGFKETCTQMIYYSVSDKLIKFLEKRGFRKSEHEQVMEL